MFDIHHLDKSSPFVRITLQRYHPIILEKKGPNSFTRDGLFFVLIAKKVVSSLFGIFLSTLFPFILFIEIKKGVFCNQR